MKIPHDDGTTDPKLYKPSQNWKDVICDKCGKSCRDEIGMNFEYAELKAVWGYGSKKDLEAHESQICEPCYDGLGIKPKVEHYL